MARMILRFKNLKELNIANSWARLNRLVENEGFPPGRMMGPNTRIWFQDEVDGWLENRPSALEAKPPLRGGAKRQREAKKAREARKASAQVDLEELVGG